MLFTPLLAALPNAPWPAPPVPAGPLIAPVLILLLCVAAGVATAFMLPGHPEATLRKIGGVALAAVGLIFLALLPSLAIGGDAVYFWIFSAIALTGAVRVVTHPRPVYSALYFVLTVFASAGLFVLLQAEFMAAALVLIYAGAILVTYVFVIMLASQATSSSPDAGPLQGVAGYDVHSREPVVASAIGFALMGVLLFVILNRAPRAAQYGAVNMPTANGGPTEALGTFLFRSQLVQLEVAGIILLVSMVGAIVIARRKVLVVPEAGETMAQARVAAGQVPEVLNTPATPVDDNPHSIPVDGTDNPRQKAYPQT